MRDLAHDKSLLAINSATVKPWSLEQLVAGCVRAGITAIAPWRDIVQAAGIEKAGRMIRSAGLTVTCLCRAGLFPAATLSSHRPRWGFGMRFAVWLDSNSVLRGRCREVARARKLKRCDYQEKG